jgi:hypothetical protein
MAITTSITRLYREGTFKRFWNLPTRTYKVALYTNAATLDSTTTVYSVTNEVVGTGYTAGGVTLAGVSVANTGDTFWVDWSTDPQWTTASFTARGMLIYQVEDDGGGANAAMFIWDFGSDKTVSGGTFTIQFPVADASNALVRIT